MANVKKIFRTTATSEEQIRAEHLERRNPKSPLSCAGSGSCPSIQLQEARNQDFRPLEISA
jgi:hypothetical protein